MYKNFDEVEKYIIGNGIKKRIVLCGAHDDAALDAVVNAKRKGVATGVLIGDQEKICALLDKMGEPATDYEIVHETREKRSAQMAVQFVRDGKADIPMKGLLQSTSYLLPIMDPVNGLLPEGGILSETTAFYYPGRDCMMFATDCAINVAPTLEEKVKLIWNAVKLAKAFGFGKVKVAAISFLEKVDTEVQSTVDADALAHMDWGEDVIVAGPFALDNALDAEAAKHKGIVSEVAGNADILLMPEMCAGNVLHKAIHFLGHLPSAGVMCGTVSPVVFTSRTDSPDTKYYSILSAILQSLLP